MRRITLLLCLIFLTVSYAQDPNIIGGQNTIIDNHPWQVSLRTITQGHICGGSIVDDDWILTAAHCVLNANPANLTIAAGITERTDNTTGQYRQVVEIIIHPNYNPNTLNNDLALLRLSQPLNFDARVKPIALTSNSALTNPGISALLTGWGLTANSGNPSLILQELEMPIISNSQANDINTGSTVVNSNMIALYQPGSAAAPGDSGGPLSVLSNGQRFLIGCSSWGESPKDQKPTIYTKITNYYSWILPYLTPPTILGDNCTCYNVNTTFTAQNVPAGATVSWGKSNNIAIVSQSTTSFTVRASSSATRAWGWVELVVNGVPYRKDIWVGNPDVPASLSGPSTVLTGALVTYNSGLANGASSYEWRLPYPYTTVTTFNYSSANWQLQAPGNTTSARAFTGLGGVSGLVQVMGKNKCGLGGARTMSVSHGSGGGGGIPKPAPQNDETVEETTLHHLPNPVIKSFYTGSIKTILGNNFRLSLYDTTGKMVLSREGLKGEETIDVSKLQNGLYILKASNGQQEVTKKLMVKN